MVTDLDSNQAGAINLTLSILCCLACFLIVRFLNSRSTEALNAEISNTLRVDKILVEAALRNSIDCSNLPNGPCKGPVDLTDKYGKLFLSKDGSQKIGAWNARIACGSDGAFWVQTSVLRKDKSFGEDPLTKKSLKWTDLVSLGKACMPVPLLMLEKSCYGFYDGLGSLPQEVLEANRGTLPAYKYCLEDQMDFPSCPDGYAVRNRYSDRFGWAGMDLAKYTNCEKIE